MASERRLRRIGHRGANALVPGNTVESFRAAVEAGADIVELDALWLRDGRPELDPARRSPLVCAHDWDDAAAREHPILAEALDAFTRAPLDTVEVDCDVKLAGREAELVEMLRERGLTERAMTSGMELESIRTLGELAPELRRGWTYPKVSRAYDRRWWAKPFVRAALVSMRRRLPAHAARMLPALGVDSMWVYHPLVTAELGRVCRDRGVELYAWTVDSPERMRALADLGVDGIVTNDPRLFDAL